MQLYLRETTINTSQDRFFYNERLSTFEKPIETDGLRLEIGPIRGSPNTCQGGSKPVSLTQQQYRQTDRSD